MRRPALNATVCEGLTLVLNHIEADMSVAGPPDGSPMCAAEAEHYRQLERGVLYLNELRWWYYWKQGEGGAA